MDIKEMINREKEARTFVDMITNHIEEVFEEKGYSIQNVERNEFIEEEGEGKEASLIFGSDYLDYFLYPISSVVKDFKTADKFIVKNIVLTSLFKIIREGRFLVNGKPVESLPDEFIQSILKAVDLGIEEYRNPTKKAYTMKFSLFADYEIEVEAENLHAATLQAKEIFSKKLQEIKADKNSKNVSGLLVSYDI